MTYIEFFDATASKNVGACLSYAPDRVVFIGGNTNTVNRHIANYTRVFEDRGIHIEFDHKTASKSNLENAVNLLKKLVETYDDCVFDITGGEEILNLALGVVCAKNPDRNIQIHKFNLRTNSMYDCDKDGTTVFKDIPSLSVAENIRIYGGDILYGEIHEEKTYLWDLTPDFLEDIEKIWTVCKGNVRLWNVMCEIFDAIEEVGTVSEDALTTVAGRSTVEAYLSQNNNKYKPAHGIIKYLLDNGLLTFFDDADETTITISYKNPQVKKCLTKAGQALEMKVFVTAREILDDSGKIMYNDAVNGVVIDWDAELNEEESQEEKYDTTNEIDILLMHNMIPVFISCKNGKVTAEELYKLNTVARRFGGEYAKMVLVATAIPKTGTQGEYLRQRAEDMGIKLIEDVQKLDTQGLADKLKNLWQN